MEQQQRQRPPRQQAPLQREHQPVSMYLLLTAAMLGGLTLFLGCLVIGLEFQVHQKQLLLLQRTDNYLIDNNQNSNNDNNNNNEPGTWSKTVNPSIPTNPDDLHLWQKDPPTGTSRQVSAQAYWNQFLQSTDQVAAVAWDPLSDSYLTDFDAITDARNDDIASAHYNQSLAFRIFALQEAARLGHPHAQHYLANALSSGIWPLREQPYNIDKKLEVSDEYLATLPQQALASPALQRQQHQAWIFWRMAAIAGHVESAMALAYRYDALKTEHGGTGSGGSTKSSDKTTGNRRGNTKSNALVCEDILPYYQAAAHGIVDALEAHPHSRAKVLPPSEKHMLYQVHMHGGTSSQLDWHNKPDESEEAIQFYHFKATRKTDPDASAAFTLATLYHFGYRGVSQNLTLALQYYDIAAVAGLEEAAGYAGWFHVWGMGMEPHQRDLYKAQKYFRQGIAKGGLKECQRRAKLGKKKLQEEELNVCDAYCLNGMGLLKLFGVPLVATVDVDEAEQYFVLAKEMGHSDAAYNLAMLKLGWKSRYLQLDDALERIQQVEKEESVDKIPLKTPDLTTDPNLPGFIKDNRPHMEQGPTQLELQHAVQFLMAAVQKGHLQARHRLALLYETGVKTVPTETAGTKKTARQKKAVEVLPKDCNKAMRHYKWIVEHASPQISNRLRKGYKEYIAGETTSSLLHYLAAAELGSDVAQVNAAFLFEQGHCLGMSPIECNKASVRLWKAAAAAGNAEACLRVGDFYYYGKLKQDRAHPESHESHDFGGLDVQSSTILARPFGWFQYILFPERHLIPVVSKKVHDLLDPKEPPEESKRTADKTDGSCTANELDRDGVCAADPVTMDDNQSPTVDNDHHDLATAAYYYRLAAEKHASPRANFNLGFLHEWGLGLKQDFPLAKRHYDLAASGHHTEADLAVQIALWSLSMHEYFVRLKLAWDDYWRLNMNGGEKKSSAEHYSTATPSIITAVPRVLNTMIGRPVPGVLSSGETDAKGNNIGEPRTSESRTKADIIWEHVLCWESLLILCLTIVLWILLQRRRQRTRR